MEVFHRHGHTVIFKADDQVYYRLGQWDGFQECNSGFIVFDDHVAAIDATTEQSVLDMVGESASLFKKPLTQIFLTHSHPDHVLGMKAAAQHDIQLICRKSTAEQLKKMNMPLPRRMIVFESRLDISEGNLHVQLFDEGCVTHSPWDMLIALPERGYVFTGDVCVPEHMLYFENADIDSWIQFMPQLRSFSLLLRGHGDFADPSYIEKQIDYLKALRKVYHTLHEKYPGSGLAEFITKARENWPDLHEPLLDTVCSVTAEQAISHIEQIYRADTAVSCLVSCNT